jgi:hypothetical protein
MAKASPADSAADLSTPSTTEYTEAHHDAAQRIQQLYRQQRSLRSANHIASQFEEARNGFTLPEAIDFINPSTSSTNDNVITIDTTSLGANNYIKVDVDPELVEAKASDDEHDPSDAALPWIEIYPLAIKQLNKYCQAVHVTRLTSPHLAQTAQAIPKSQKRSLS